MLIDWNNPPSLRFRRAAVRDAEALGRLHQRRVKHKPSKAHATKSEIARRAQRKAKEASLKIARQKMARIAYHAAVRAYWSGQGEHP